MCALCGALISLNQFLVFVTDHLRLLDVGLRTGTQESVSPSSGIATGDTGRFVAAGLTQWQQAFRIAISNHQTVYKNSLIKQLICKLRLIS